uniref:LRRK2 ARM repeat domain-containing protein n=1 Tax=Tetraselmis chuii TaxID=63592 RepID=A0A7S1X5W7_9CHLO
MLELLVDVLATMHAHSPEAGVQEAACHAIWALAYDNDRLRVEARRLRVLKDVRAAMQSFPDSWKVQGAACGAIYNLVVENKDNQVEARGLGMLSDVQAAMQAHTESVEVQVCGALAMCALSKWPCQAMGVQVEELF